MFGRALLPLLVLALGAAAAASPEVLRLDADSFEPSIASRPFVAVAFVAPWCAHCKRLEPEWRAAASKLAARGRNIALATLDTTAGDANAALAARHDVRGFPSIRIFRDGDLQSAEAYEGPPPVLFHCPGVPSTNSRNFCTPRGESLPNRPKTSRPRNAASSRTSTS